MDRIPAYIRRVDAGPGRPGLYRALLEPAGAVRVPAPLAGCTAQRRPADLRSACRHGPGRGEGRDATTNSPDNILPRIARLGYNAIQLMAVMEHPYYGSFGYHVSNFFAAVSRFGTPSSSSSLIDTAHSHGHPGSDGHHSQPRGEEHTGRPEPCSTAPIINISMPGRAGSMPRGTRCCSTTASTRCSASCSATSAIWLEEFHFDGFRFDGVTSMMYLDHGLGSGFGSYDDYFGLNVDYDAVTYLQLANEVAHARQPCSDHGCRGRLGHGRPGPPGRGRRTWLRLSARDGRPGLLDQAAQREEGRRLEPRRSVTTR